DYVAVAMVASIEEDATLLWARPPPEYEALIIHGDNKAQVVKPPARTRFGRHPGQRDRKQGTAEIAHNVVRTLKQPLDSQRGSPLFRQLGLKGLAVDKKAARKVEFGTEMKAVL
ncbi:hypothetical protein ACLOJK_019996, partial [Asimina triloba]